MGSKYLQALILVTVLMAMLLLVACGDDDDDTSGGGTAVVEDDDDDTYFPPTDDDDDDADDDDDVDVDDDDDDDDDSDDDDDDVEPSNEDCETYGYTSTPTIIRGPYLQHVTQSTIRILWQTDVDSNTVVRFGPTEGLGFFQCDGEQTTYHEIEVVGLDTESVYNYLVRSDGAESTISTFASAPYEDSPFSFAVYGDTRSDPISHAMVAHGIHDMAPDFVFNVGDIVGDGGEFDQYDPQHFEPTAELTRDTPYYIAIGNHEHEAEHFYKFFSYPDPERYYSFDYGNSRFISLNTNRLYIQGTPQYVWLEAELQNAHDMGKEFIFVMAHHPAYSEGWDSPGYVGEILMRFTVIPLLEQYSVDAFFAGHTHDYERGAKNGMVHIITGGGGSALDSWQQDLPVYTVYFARYHFLLAEVAGKNASFQAMDPDGTVFDTWEIQH